MCQKNVIINTVKSLGVDGILLIGESVCDADLYYASRFLSSDRFAALVSDRIYLLVSSMEKSRAEIESQADVVETTSDYSIKSKISQFESFEIAYMKVLEEFISAHGISILGMSKCAPAGVYKSLSERFEVNLLHNPFESIRAIKAPEEISAIKDVQRRCEAAMDLALKMLKRAVPSGDFLLLDGSPVTAEKIRGVIDMKLAELGCETIDTIVCGGPMSSNPHSRGSGPLPPDMPIVIDIFPRSKSTRYFADMTRTVVRGEPSIEIQEMYQAVMEAQNAGLRCIKDGISGAEVHAVVSKTFDDFGYKDREGKGFIHSTGHGVGLSIHEKPSLSEYGETLRSGNVVTVEPGLYYPDIGGVRIEDLVVVRENGHENLTGFEKNLLL